MLKCLSPLHNEQSEVQQSLTKWKYLNNAEALAPTYFQIWWDTLYTLLWDEMMSDKMALVQPNDYNTFLAMKNLPDDYTYFDNHTTPQKETLTNIINISYKAMTVIVDSLDRTAPEELKWYQHKHTSIIHIAQIPAFSKLSVNNGGYRNIVNASSETHGPSWRMVVELTQPVKAWGVYPGGQSGNPGSKYYDNFIDDWAAGNYYELQFYSDITEASKNALFTISFN